MRGVTTACLKEFGKDPSMREKFTNLVIEGRRISRQSLRRNVGIGSSEQDLVGDSQIHLWTSSSVTGVKALKAGGTESGTSLKEPEVGKVSLILLILLEKKEANMSARLLSEL